MRRGGSWLVASWAAGRRRWVQAEPRVRGIMYDPPHQGIVMDGWPTMVVGVKRCPSVDGGSCGATPPFRPTVNDGTSRSAFRHSRGCGGWTFDSQKRLCKLFCRNNPLEGEKTLAF